MFVVQKISNKACHFLVTVLKTSELLVVIYKGGQNSSRTTTFYSSQGPCSCCIRFKSILVGRRSFVPTIKTIVSSIKCILTIVICI